MPEKKTTKKVINSLTREAWDPLLKLIPEIECTEKFGDMGGLDKNADGSVNFPYYVPADVVSHFQKTAYDMEIVIPFDWPGWEQGQIMFREDSFDFDSVDVYTKCKLITAIIRADRFSDGTLINAFQSGLILKVLKSIARQVNWFPDELTEAMHSEFQINEETEIKHKCFTVFEVAGTKNMAKIEQYAKFFNVNMNDIERYLDLYKALRSHSLRE